MTQENQQAEPETAPGGYGTPTAEQEAAGTQGGQQSGGGGTSSGGADTNEPQSGAGQNPVPHDMDLPSSAADIDEANDDSQGSAPVSSESGQEAAGIPDGSGNDLPQEESPNDDDESFDAG
ncbi:hypothetical protein J2S98_002314 [Arthrobacter oryzae]|uniref:hypothetical protein n=1 Tax=Arthrobacter TaxID=1663 RepID=UPI001F176AEE|nr:MULTISPECIES: hypothetical protein [Arthrobacter]MDP9987155.1 hypothetical protein [Arthrobacter oryzae]UKA71481.1 hypothetical protein LFT49_01645 [Arthrobacter sp. FW306-06-A]